MKLEKYLYNTHITWAILFLILSTMLCFIKFMELPEGGAMTFLSMAVLWLIPYCLGFKEGFLACLIFGFLKFGVTYITGEHINYNIFALILEYPVAFCGMSLGALLPQNRNAMKYIKKCQISRTHALENCDDCEEKNIDDDADESEYYDGSIKNQMLALRQGDDEQENSKSGLILGYLIGVFFILISYVASSLLFYNSQSNMTSVENFLYQVFYDSSYLLFEGLFSVIIFMLPPVYSAISYVKHVANNPIDKPYIYGF